MNSIMERWVGNVRRECLDRLLMTGEGHFPKVLGEYERHCNLHCPHRSRDQQPPQPPQPAVVPPSSTESGWSARKSPNGLINEYR